MKSHNFIDLTGKTFGLLTALDQAERISKKSPRWNCICACGNYTVVHGKHLRGMKTISCGCYKKTVTSKIFTTHGKTNTAEYKIWCGMKRRCYNHAERCYPRYGGRGISVSNEWRYSFQAFLEDMGARPSNTHTIERIDNDGNYTKENCKWLPKAEQARNRRSNVFLTHDGITMILKDWSVRTGLRPGTIMARKKYGWSDGRALTTPSRLSK